MCRRTGCVRGGALTGLTPWEDVAARYNAISGQRPITAARVKQIHDEALVQLRAIAEGRPLPAKGRKGEIRKKFALQST